MTMGLRVVIPRSFKFGLQHGTSVFAFTRLIFGKYLGDCAGCQNCGMES